jgi:hypothetical protein
VRLVEFGTSAGLNLRADHFRYVGASAAWGDPASPVVFERAWLGTLPPLDAPLRIVSRLGTDIAPVDAASADGRLRLESFVWPDQSERLSRLRAAFAVAAQVPVRLAQATAVDTVLALRLLTGTTTVVWHSIMWQYQSPAERADVLSALEALGSSATPDARLAHLSLELEDRPDAADPRCPVVLRTWPGGQEQLLGWAPPHGLPVTWTRPAS